MAERVKIVVDSSVAVKWFTKEEKSEKALSLMDSHAKGRLELWASNLLYYEVGNALRYKPDYNGKTLRKALTFLLKLRLHTTLINVKLLTRAGEIAYDGDVSLYDAIPVAVAEYQETTCITADEGTQYKKLKPKGYPIKLL